MLTVGGGVRVGVLVTAGVPDCVLELEIVGVGVLVLVAVCELVAVGVGLGVLDVVDAGVADGVLEIVGVGVMLLSTDVMYSGCAPVESNFSCVNVSRTISIVPLVKEMTLIKPELPPIAPKLVPNVPANPSNLPLEIAI